MQSILTTEEKKYLKIISNYVRSHGLKEGQIEIDMDYGEFNPNRVEDIKYFSNSYNVEIPDEYLEIVKKILDYVINNKDLTADVDDINYERIEIDLDTVSKSLTVLHYYSYYETGEPEGSEWDETYYEDSPENFITTIFDAIQEDPELNSQKELNLRYNGSGDSGYIDDYFEEGGAVPEPVESWCYEVLGNLHGGWEINEGSQGIFTFLPESRLVMLNHTFNVEETETKTLFEEDF